MTAEAVGLQVHSRRMTDGEDSFLSIGHLTGLDFLYQGI
jgi:hypothetical protein